MIILRRGGLWCFLLLVVFRAGASAVPLCAGDCNRDGIVAVNELVTAMAIGLGQLPADTCADLDTNRDGRVVIDELLRAVQAALNDCGPGSLTSAALFQPGPYSVGITTRTFVDDTRHTPAHGTAPELPNRTLVAEIWYPIDPVSNPAPTGQRDAPLSRVGAPYPLVVHSHGFMDFRFGNAYANRHLASHGFVVVAPEYPLTNYNVADADSFVDVPNQPLDIRFLIDRMLALSAAETGAFARAIDHQEVGLSGLSLGGATTLLATFHWQLRDPRVRAAAVLSPGLACSLGPEFYADVTTPLLIVHGDIDAIVAYNENALFAFGQANKPKYLLTQIGGTHTGFADVASVLFENSPNADSIGCSQLEGSIAQDRSSLFDLLGGSEAGLIAGNCPLPCLDGNSQPIDPDALPEAMRPSRQHALTGASLLAFFQAELRGRSDMRRFLEETLALENTDVTVQTSR